MYKNQLTRFLRRRILLFSVISLLVSNSTVAFLCLSALYSQLRANAEKELFLTLRSKTTALEEHLSRARDIAMQIASRTVIAQKLEDYNRELISLDDLVAFTSPKLEDPMSRSADVVGICRLDARGDKVVQVGLPLSSEFRLPSYGPPPAEVTVEGPVIFNDIPFFCVTAPILNRQSVHIGSDVVLFKLDQIHQILDDFKSLGSLGRVYLSMANDKGEALLLASQNATTGNHQDSGLLEPVLDKASRGESGIVEAGEEGRCLLVYGPLGGIRWGICIGANKKDVLDPIVHRITDISGVIALIVLVGTAGMMFLLRPLMGRMILREDELQEEVREKTGALELELTEKKQSQERLREQESFIRSVLDSLSAHIAVLDAEGRIVQVNEAWKRFARENGGEVPSAYLGCNYLKTWEKALNCGEDEMLETQLDGIRGVLEGSRRQFTIEYPCHSPSEERWFIMHAMALSHSHAGLVVSHENITGLKQVEEALRKSMRKMDTLADRSPSGIWETDMFGSYTYVSRRWCEITGLSPREAMGPGWLNMLREKDRDRVAGEMHETFMKDRPYSAEYRIPRPDGRISWVISQATSIKNDHGRTERWIGTITDITDRKNMEESLKASEERLHIALSAARAGMWGWDLRTNENYWSRAAWEIYGLEPFTTHASYDLWLETIHPDDRECTVHTVMEAVRDEKELNAEWRVNNVAGKERWLMSRGRPTRDAGGQLSGFIGIVMDITERKAAERALQNSLDEKVALLKEVHHRVKNNLQIVASLLGLQANRSKSSEVLEALEDTRNRVRSMALLHDLLYRSENLASINLPTYMDQLCRQVVFSFGPAAYKIKVENRTARVGLPLTQAVPCGLIVNELMSNAMKHAFPDGRQGKIVVDVTLAGKDLCVLKFHDDGVGLPPELNLQQTGTLGLQLVFDLGTQLDGKVTVESTPQGGTFVTLTFPLNEDPPFGSVAS